ncbi:MAG: hypothetical protein IJD98_03425 [Oscillospiraceae bacterium]|nr:hypothetical protein [Oscillospiraceae bacterium]
MKKSTFVNLIVGTIGGLLFALGMCMCLLPEWNAFKIGVVCTAIGAIVLLAQSVVAWLRSGRKIKINWKLAGKVLYGVFAALVLGVGMCMIMVWNLMLPGILVGIVGIVLLLMLIPMFLGLK